MNTLKIESKLAEKYKYKPLPGDLSEKYREFFESNIPEFLHIDGAEKFWDNVFKVFNCEKYNAAHFHNTIGSFVINHSGDKDFPDEDFVANCLYEASKI